ncbi:aminoglycoside phosphotransferase [Methylophaga sp. 41_12_T18]|nr:aminoglycoside phosphotransferase [Methylophaga sp. 41_12_T18]
MYEDNRLKLIKAWLPTIIGTDKFTIESASSDASFRRYFRVTHDQTTWIVMDAPPEKEDTEPFIKIASFLDNHDVHVPKILANDQEQGFLLLSDLGQQPYLNELNDNSADQLYHFSIKSLLQIQLCPIDSKINLPTYDRELLQREMMLFPEWYLDRHLNIPAPDFLQASFDVLIANALEQPQVVVHRDYHSRNLMHTNDNSPGIIDFQDAVIGPITYDLVSLLRDCYICWPQHKLDQWIKDYVEMAQKQGLLTGVTLAQFTKWFDLMGLQRHIKILGIFCRLNYRDNKANYLDDLPLTMQYVKQITSKYAEFEKLNQFLNQQTDLMVI